MMMMCVFEGLDGNTLDFELSLLFNSLFILIECLDLLIKPLFKLFRENQNVIFKNRNRLWSRPFGTFLTLFLLNKVILAIDFELISFNNLANVGSAWLH